MPQISWLEYLRDPPLTPMRPVYAFVGKDDYAPWRCLRTLKDHVLAEDAPGTTVTDYDELPDPRAVFDALRTATFLGMKGRRVVIVRTGDALVQKVREQIERYLERPAETGVFVLLCAALPSNTRVFRAAVAAGLVVSCDRVTWRELPDWVALCAQARGLRLSPQAARALTDVTGLSPAAVESELEKIAVFKAGERAVTVDDVAALAGLDKSRTIFDLVDGACQGDAARAFEALHQLLLAGESVQMIVGMLARSFRQIWQVWRLQRAHADQARMMQEVGAPPFVIKKLLAQAGRIRDERQIAARVELLARADLESKTQAIGPGETQRWMESLIARLALKS